jgi:hypothetical protein
MKFVLSMGLQFALLKKLSFSSEFCLPRCFVDCILHIESPSFCAGLFEQGLTSFLDFKTLTEKDITQICANVCCPGVLILSPMLPGCCRGRDVAAAAADHPLLPPQIRNPGTLVGHVVEVRLKMLCYFVKHLVCVQRLTLVAANKY